MTDDFFQHKAEAYDDLNYRVNNVENIAASILSRINFTANMNIMDFGSGTGLLLERIAPFVGSITAVDISKSMIEQLNQKRNGLNCELEILEMDLSTSHLDRKFDGIISSMTMHHINNIKSIFTKFYSMLNPGGFIAIADLETEDGSFHTEDTGVFHFGFEVKELSDMALEAGFGNIEVATVSKVQKNQGDYPVLLLTATV